MGANSSPVSYHIVRKFSDPSKEIQAYSISGAEFKRIACGFAPPSSVNPKAENLFAKYGIEDCGYFGDTIIHHVLYKGGLRCNVIDEVWRLRYKEWPYHVQSKPNQQSVLNPATSGPGWAREELQPSEGQLNILKGYGIQHFVDEIIYGENAFRLLKDIQDDTWVSTYRSS
ncbi:MAG: hypothetical protein Fur0041_14600 [Bacteroidia bacterium]